MRRTVVVIVLAVLAACSAEPSASTVGAPSPTTAATGPAAEPEVPAEPDHPTSSTASTTVTVRTTPEFAILPPHVSGRFVPASGFAVIESPYELSLFFAGRSTPDAVEIADQRFEPDRRGDWFVSTTLDLEPGENTLPVTVHDNGTAARTTVTITYVPGGEARLVYITAADNEAITVDYLVWEDDREFPGPEDDGSATLHELPVDPAVRVVIAPDDDPAVDYRWLIDAVRDDELINEPDWIPQYPYWITTTTEGTVVEILMVPLG